MLPFSFTGLTPLLLILMLVAGILHHLFTVTRTRHLRNHR